MEREEQKVEQSDSEVEEQEHEEATTPLVRKSRNGDDSKIVAIAAVDVEASNGVSESNGHPISAVDAEVTNGVSVTNGHAIQSEIAENEELITPAAEEKELEESDGVLENGEVITPAAEEEQKIEESDGVLENESESMNGEQNSDNLVFYEKIEGIWKCRICTWTYGNGSVCVDLLQNHRGQLHNLMNIKTLDFESEGVKSAAAYIGEEQLLKDPGHIKSDGSSLNVIVHNNHTSKINGRYEEEAEESDIFSSNLQHTDSSSQEGETSYEPSKEIESAEIDEDDLEITELDVERVIQKQTTHDLFCPNCKSCITKRVILRKRKRGLKIPDEDVKRNKTGTATGTKIGTVSTQSAEDQIYEEGEVGDNDAQIPTTDEDERDRGPHIFRCLSCFSIFIPAGDGFKLFRIFGDKSGKENVQDVQAPNVKNNWFSKIFTPNKQETLLEQETSSQMNVQQDNSAIGGDRILTYKPPVNEMVVNGIASKLDTKATEAVDATTEEFGVYNMDQPVESKSRQEVHVNRDSDLLTILENSEEVPKPNQIVQPRDADKEVIQHSPPSFSVVQSTDEDGTLNISVSIPHQEQDITATVVTKSILENKNADSRSNDSGEVYAADVPQQLITETKFEVHPDESMKTEYSSSLIDAPVEKGNDTVITIDTHPHLSSHIVEGIAAATASQSETQISNAARGRTEVIEGRKIEVIKSMVYGGLAESITSLSVVSSAVGGGAASLNVLALGAANLIGGLFVISHNLWDLRCYRDDQVSNQITEQRDRYIELLGRRQNFMLHVVVAIISYLVFGLVAPVVYGFSFRGSDDKELKLLVAAASSLLCILILAVAKAYVQRPPKSYLKTVMIFMIMGLMVSGVSYAAGEFVGRLLEKLGLFEASSAAPNLLVQEMRPVGSGWASF